MFSARRSDATDLSVMAGPRKKKVPPPIARCPAGDQEAEETTKDAKDTKTTDTKV